MKKFVMTRDKTPDEFSVFDRVNKLTVDMSLKLIWMEDFWKTINPKDVEFEDGIKPEEVGLQSFDNLI
jgi:hypothetical protein